MQHVRILTRDRAIGAREIRAGQHLPYARHVDDRTIETRGGMLMQMIRLHGAGADGEARGYRERLRDAILQSSGSPGFAVYHHAVRRAVSPGAFANELVLTLIHRPPLRRMGLVDRLLGHPAEADSACALPALDAAREALTAALVAHSPQPLSVYQSPQGHCSQPLEFLSSLYHGEWLPVLLPTQDAGAYLPYRRIGFGQETIELGAAGELPRHYAAIVSIKGYPGQAATGLVDELLHLPFGIAVSQSFGFVERKARRSAAGRFGEHHMTIAVRGGTPPEVARGMAEVQAVLAELGIVAVREEIALEPAFWAQFPGNFSHIARRGLVPAAEFAGFAG